MLAGHGVATGKAQGQGRKDSGEEGGEKGEREEERGREGGLPRLGRTPPRAACVLEEAALASFPPVENQTEHGKNGICTVAL